MNLVPRFFVAGLFAPVLPPGEVTADRLNRAWSEIQGLYGYRRLELAPEGNAANFVGASDEEGVTIQPPLIQVRDRIALTPEQSTDKAQSVFRVVTRHLGLSQLFNLGVKHIYHAPIPDKDSRGFVLRNILGKGEQELSDLQSGGTIWAGVKYVVSHTDVQYTLLIEPLQADQAFLFIDLDAQFPGPTTLDAVKDRAREAERYLTQAVAMYLDKVSS